MIDEVQAGIWGSQGVTEEERERNEALLSGYDPAEYPVNITGYNGMNLQEIAVWKRLRAVRTRVGGKGNYKAGMTVCNDGSILIAVCRKINEQATCRVLLYRSTDCGDSWRNLEVQTDLWGKEPALACLPDGTLLMTVEPLRVPVADTTQTLIYRSTDEGTSWEPHISDGYGVPRNFLVEGRDGVMFARPKAPGFLARTYEKQGKPFQPSPNLEIWRCRCDEGKFCRSLRWTSNRGGRIAPLRHNRPARTVRAAGRMTSIPPRNTARTPTTPRGIQKSIYL